MYQVSCLFHGCRVLRLCHFPGRRRLDYAELLGVYRNCVCKAGLHYWLNLGAGIVELATDTEAHRYYA